MPVMESSNRFAGMARSYTRVSCRLRRIQSGVPWAIPDFPPMQENRSAGILAVH